MIWLLAMALAGLLCAVGIWAIVAIVRRSSAPGRRLPPPPYGDDQDELIE